MQTPFSKKVGALSTNAIKKKVEGWCSFIYQAVVQLPGSFLVIDFSNAKI